MTTHPRWKMGEEGAVVRALRGFLYSLFLEVGDGNREHPQPHPPPHAERACILLPRSPQDSYSQVEAMSEPREQRGTRGLLRNAQHPSSSSSFGGGVIVHRAVCSWLCPPSLSTVQPAARMAGACLVSCPDADCAPFGQPAGGGNRADSLLFMSLRMSLARW